jgi:acyl-CoA thioesterase-1
MSSIDFPYCSAATAFASVAALSLVLTLPVSPASAADTGTTAQTQLTPAQPATAQTTPASTPQVADTPTGQTSAAQAQTYVCRNKAHLARLSSPLRHMARRIASGQPVTIMALGSSSTAGAGASSPAASYPSRLEAELKTRFPNLAIKVINRGVNGEEASDMLKRFDQVEADDKPDVVIWQVGTNAVLRDDPLRPVDRLIKDGLARMRLLGADVVLIDPQFAPKVIAKSDAEDMVELIAADAMSRGVDLFPRFAIMREWRDKDGVPFDAFLSPDQLHMNDWGYSCLAKLLGAAVADAATRPIAAARANPR